MPLNSSLYQFLASTSDVQQLRDELAAIKKSLFQANAEAIQETLNAKVRHNVAAVLRTEILLPNKSTADLSGDIEELLNDLDNLPVVNLQLAFVPTHEQLMQLHDWFITSLQLPVLLSLEYQPELLTGLKIDWKGHYLDLSLGEQLRQNVSAAWLSRGTPS